jgi:hypothetical protein
MEESASSLPMTPPIRPFGAQASARHHRILPFCEKVSLRKEAYYCANFKPQRTASAYPFPYPYPSKNPSCRRTDFSIFTAITPSCLFSARPTHGVGGLAEGRGMLPFRAQAGALSGQHTPVAVPYPTRYVAPETGGPCLKPGYAAPSGRRTGGACVTQGVALGWVMLPLRGAGRRASSSN